MTRFQFLREFESKIERGTQEEVQRIIDYCRHRLGTAKMKYHEKHWRKLLKLAEVRYDARFPKGNS